MSRIEEEPGWILHRRPWRETSLLIEYLGRDAGRVGLVARGARAPRSAWRGLAEPFSPLSAAWTRRGEMGTLVTLESAGRRLVLAGRALWCGLYANELVLRLLPRDDPHTAIHDDYSRLIGALAAGEQAQSILLRRFELDLLTALGVAPDLQYEAVSGAEIRGSDLYRLDPEGGLIRVDRPGRSVFSGAVIQALRDGTGRDLDDMRQARMFMRELIDYHLGGRPLETRRLFRGEPNPGQGRKT
ncbi:MAG: DNA repair protein RecO [Pseudomonadota bacterium]|nr:MAG: DNA repair protein RecO [Pseudomonadota bacterium]